MTATPTETTESALELVPREQVLALYGHSRSVLLIGWGVGAAVVAVYWRTAGPRVTLGWFAAVMLWQFTSLHRLRTFEAATRAPQGWDPGHWARRNAVAAGVAGLILGGAMWCFYRPEFGDARFLILMVLLGMAAGSVMVFGHHRPSVWAFMIGLALPTEVRLLVASRATASGLIGAGLFAFYAMMLLDFARRHAHLLEGAIRMRHEQRALVAELRRRTEETERASQAKTRFFAAASHDLRQPLHALSYYTTLLNAPSPPPDVAERISQCVRSLEDLFDGILGIARLDAGRVEPRRRDVRLNDILQRLRCVHASSAAEQSLRLRWHIPGDPLLHTDPVLIERVVGNLLSNALRYTVRGGVLLAARRRGKDLAIIVADTGIGMTPDELASAFDEFVQLDNPQRDASRGVGLGLPTVRRLCELLGHRLIARSVPGRGSWFEVHVPIGSEAVQTAAGDAADPQVHGDRLHGRVLLVDDHEPTRHALQRTLSQWGLQCDTAMDAAAALRLSDGHMYDVLLCDFRLPGALSGLDLLQDLRGRQPRCCIAAVISGESEQPALPDGVQWLRKPLRPVRLRALMMSRLGAAPMQAADPPPANHPQHP